MLIIKKYIYCIQWIDFISFASYWNLRGWFFQLFNWLQLFFYGEKLSKVAGHSQNRSKIDHLKGSVDWFQLFIIDFQLFYFLTRIITAFKNSIILHWYTWDWLTRSTIRICFSTKPTAFKRKSKDWLAQNQNNVSEWSYMSIRGLLFQWASTIKIQLSVLV